MARGTINQTKYPYMRESDRGQQYVEGATVRVVEPGPHKGTIFVIAHASFEYRGALLSGWRYYPATGFGWYAETWGFRAVELELV